MKDKDPRFSLDSIPFGAPQREKPKQGFMSSNLGLTNTNAIVPSVVAQHRSRQSAKAREPIIEAEVVEVEPEVVEPPQKRTAPLVARGSNPAGSNIIEAEIENEPEEDRVIDLYRRSPMQQAMADSQREMAKLISHVVEDTIDKLFGS